MRKFLVLDTSVLLYDKESVHSFPGNDVVLPLTVLDELDRHKEKPGLLGENARYVGVAPWAVDAEDAARLWDETEKMLTVM